MNDLPGAGRTHPMAGTPDGFTTDLRTALARLDRERRSSFARPGQRAEALNRFEAAVRAALAKVRGADRAALTTARQDLQADRHAVTALRGDLARADEQNHALTAHISELETSNTALNAQVLDLGGELAGLRADLEQARYTITELQGLAATHLCEPLPERHPRRPEWSEAAQEPPGATQTAKPARSRAGSGSARSKPAESRTAPRQPVKEG